MRCVHDNVRFGSTEISYQIFRSADRQTVSITVRSDQTVSVQAPKGLRRTRIAEAVHGKAAWIVRCWERNGRAHRTQARVLSGGETLRYLGRQYHLRVCRSRRRRGDPDSVHLFQGRFVVEIALKQNAAADSEAVRTAIVAWYRDHARTRIEDLVGPMGSKIGVTWRAVRIRELRTRWGSAGSNGILYFNWRIIMAPRRLVEYVVAHELCHLRYPNHSPAFWRMLGGFMPDYVLRRSDLDRLGPLLDV